MIRLKWQYPGDPVETVELMFGAEFSAANPDRHTRVSVEHPDGWREVYDSGPLDEVVCDSYNAEVAPTDPCALSPGRLYCWSCYATWIKPYLKLDVLPEVLLKVVER